MIKLGVCNTDGTIAQDAIWRGIQSASGRPALHSMEDVIDGLQTIERSLKTWAEARKDELVAELDEFCGYDRLHTKRLNESVRVAISRILEGRRK